MPQPINKTKRITEVIGLSGPLLKQAQTIASESNPRLGMVLDLINASQKVAEAVLPYLPDADFDALTPDGTPLPGFGITRADWDDVAVSSWGAAPAGGTVPNIMAAFAASRAFTTAYVSALQPAIAPRLLVVDPNTGAINVRPATLVLTTTEVDLVRSEVEAYRDALEPISEA